MMLKTRIRQLMMQNSRLRGILLIWRKFRVNRQFRNKKRNEIFAEIYKSGTWGGNGEYYSGEGSYKEEFVAPYCQLVKKFLKEHNVKTVVDLGCGDFHVASLWLDENIDYKGVDIVEDMIQSHREKYGADNRHFYCLDMVTDELPDGDLCLIRQVLQHLTNQEIGMVLKKLAKYPYVIITEHRTVKEDAAAYNVDIPAGAGTRNTLQSGVYLEEAPFLCNYQILMQIPYQNDTKWKAELVSGLLQNNSI